MLNESFIGQLEEKGGRGGEGRIDVLCVLCDLSGTLSRLAMGS